MSTVTFDKGNKTTYILRKHGDIKSWFTMGDILTSTDDINEIPGVEVLDISFFDEMGSLVLRNLKGL